MSSPANPVTMASRVAFHCPDFYRMAMSEKGNVAVVDKIHNCVFVYGKGTLHNGDEQWMQRKITSGLVKPNDVCFGPHEHLLISDNGDCRVKIFDLGGSVRQVNQIVMGHNDDGELDVQDATRGREFSFSRLKTFRQPQNIVLGRGPLYQLFISTGVDIVLINMDWNEMIPLSFFHLRNSLHWCFVQNDMSLVCDNVSSVQDHRASHKVGGFNPLAITKAQFCAMFYHVTETRNTGFLCLSKSECTVGKRNDRRKFAETVVLYVRVMDQNGCMIFHARYGNCYEGAYANTIHAEYFMLVDEDFRQAVKILCDLRGGLISMYMSKQPCCRSTGHGKKTELKVKDCSRDLIKFYNLHCSPNNIKLTINICQLYKADMITLQQEASLSVDIINAQLGLKLLLCSGIQLNAMTQECWRKLAEPACIELPLYQGSDRQKLDKYIDKVLSEIKARPFFLLPP